MLVDKWGTKIVFLYKMNDVDIDLNLLRRNASVSTTTKCFHGEIGIRPKVIKDMCLRLLDHV